VLLTNRIQDNGAESDFELPTRLLISTNGKPEPAASDSEGAAGLFVPTNREPEPTATDSVERQGFVLTNREPEPAATDSDGAVRLSFRPIGSTNAASDASQFWNLFIALLCPLL